MNIESFKMSIVKDKPSKYQGSQEWIPWGIDNLYPYQLLDLFNLSPANSSAIQFKADLTNGDGFIIPDGFEDFFRNSQMDLLLERVSLDLNIYNAFAFQVISDRLGNIAKLEYIDVSSIRLLKNDKESVIVSRDWRDALEEKIIFRKFNKATLKKDKIQIYLHCIPAPGMYFYAKPDYDCALEDIELEREIHLFEKNSVKNGYYPSIVFDFPDVPSPEERQKIKEALKKTYQGGQGAGEAVVLFGQEGQKVNINTITPSTNADILSGLRVWNRECILMAHKITSPELLGISIGGASLGGDANKIMVASEYFYNTVIKKRQNQITRAFKEVLEIEELSIANSKPLAYIPESILTNNWTQNEIREMYGYEPINVETPTRENEQ